MGVVSEEAARVPTVEPSSSRDIMRLVSQNLATPVSLGHTSVTITRTPRSTPAHLPASSFPEQSPRHSSLTLTPSTVQQHSPTLIVTSHQPARTLVLAQPLNTSHAQAPPSRSNHSNHSHPVSVQSRHTSLPLVVSQPYPGHAAMQSTTTLVRPLVVATSSRPSSGALVRPAVAVSARPAAPARLAAADCGAVNLTVGGSREESGRACKGKRYQEFIEDGRIAGVGSRKRRSHRSGGGEESEEETALNLSQVITSIWSYGLLVEYAVCPTSLDQFI